MAVRAGTKHVQEFIAYADSMIAEIPDNSCLKMVAFLSKRTGHFWQKG